MQLLNVGEEPSLQCTPPPSSPIYPFTEIVQLEKFGDEDKHKIPPPAFPEIVESLKVGEESC